MNNQKKGLLVAAILTAGVIFSQSSVAQTWPQPESAYSNAVSPQWVDEKPSAPALVQPPMQTPPVRQNFAQQIPNKVRPMMNNFQPGMNQNQFWSGMPSMKNTGNQPWGNWGGQNSMPQMPNMNNFNTNSMPRMPMNTFNSNGMPQMPSMGNWNMPNMDMGNWNMPNMPEMGNMPGMPNMNNMEMPSPSFTIPTVHVPTFN